MDRTLEDSDGKLLRQRLVGLAVLLALAFLLSLLLPGAPTPEEGEPSTTVSLTGEQRLTEADAVPPPDDLPIGPIAPIGPMEPIGSIGPTAETLPPADAEVEISDVETSAVPPPPAPPPAAALKLTPRVATDKRPQDVAEPRPAPARPAAQAVVTPRPKLAESVAPPAPSGAATGTVWYVQIGSYSAAGSAQTVVALLRKLGVSATITRITGKKGNALDRVRAGPYASEAAAKAAHARIARNGYPQSQIVQEPSR